MARKRNNNVENVGHAGPDAPLDTQALLQQAQPVLKELTEDLLERADASPGITRALKARHEQEKSNDLTADSFAVWRRHVVVQIAASWLLSCVFVRTLEDRGLLDTNRIAGEGAKGAQHTFFQLAPYLTERDYLLAVFRELEHFPATKELFDREHNLAWRLAPSAKASAKLLELFRTPSAEAPAFRFGQPDTRFLGDLYQDLSEDVRKRYALLQTPDFVEHFILDRTLEPAIEEFGLDETTLIDPTCGSGHFLLGAFDRLFERWIDRGKINEEAVQLALGSVYGVDINPYAVSIARFRLTLAALKKLGTEKLATAPRVPLHVVVADSLIEDGFAQLPTTTAADWGNAFSFVDEKQAKDVLRRHYSAVVGNPPYITVKDKALRERYRKSYESAGGKYALSAPFMERFFQMARRGGFTGQITANSFMKREFGKGLVEKVLPQLDVQLIVNTAGAYIPEHGTPTVLLFGRRRAPESPQVHAVLARRGEPSTPDDPANGEVWSSIRDHWNEEGFENEYITVEPVDREKLAKHPWSLEGGGAGELKQLLEERAQHRLGDIAESIGFASFTGLDDIFILPNGVPSRHGIASELVRPIVVGEDVRDWSAAPQEVAICPYDPKTQDPIDLTRDSKFHEFLWPYRTVANAVTSFGGKTRADQGDDWWTWYRWQPERYKAAFRIAFAEVATHNHFVLDRGGKVFKQTAPIIKLPDTATEDDHLALLAYLNSSTACFWMKQVSYAKASAVGDISTEKGREEANRYAFSGTQLQKLPLPPFSVEQRELAVVLARELLDCAEQLAKSGALGVLRRVADGYPLEAAISETEAADDRTIKRAVYLQEELDWLVYAGFGLAECTVSTEGTAAYDERPFLARDKKLRGEWTSRARETSQNRELRSLESPVFKRLWLGRQGVFGHSARALDEDALNAAVAHLMDCVERSFDLGEVRAGTELWTTASGGDSTTLRTADAFSLQDGSKHLAAEAVPFLAASYFSETGLEKHRIWRAVWELQRREDAGENVGEIPVPPKYAQKDFRDTTYWRLRGKLDVPKERFISYPGCESDKDGEPVYSWAGWDHAHRAKALAALYVDRKDNEGWSSERLQPMLAGLLELLPWVKQWHPEPDPDTGEPLGTFLETWLEGECQSHGFTYDDLRAWRPPKKTGGGTKRAGKKRASQPKSKKNATQPES